MSNKHHNSHTHCVVCGQQNLLSLRLKFQPDMNGGVSAVFLAHEALQGYEGMLHGGVVSMLLDGAMTHCLFHRNIEAVTGDLRVRFLRPVPCKALLDIRAWVISATPPLFRLKAELGQNQVVMAWAEATFVQRNKKKRPKT